MDGRIDTPDEVKIRLSQATLYTSNYRVCTKYCLRGTLFRGPFLQRFRTRKERRRSHSTHVLVVSNLRKTRPCVIPDQVEVTRRQKVHLIHIVHLVHGKSVSAWLLDRDFCCMAKRSKRLVVQSGKLPFNSRTRSGLVGSRVLDS